MSSSASLGFAMKAPVLPERLERLGSRVDAAVLEHQADTRPQSRPAGRGVHAEDA